MKDVKKKKGFTLIEVLGVIIILAIITSIGLVIYSNVTNESKEIVNAVTKQSIDEAALSYVKEFKLLEDRFWYDKEGSTTGEKFTCTTIKQLINTGYLPNNPVDATTGEKYDDNTTIMVERDANKVLKTGVTIDAIECDNSPPKVEITFAGTNVTDSSTTKWYNNENDATVKIKPIVGIAGVAEYEYFIKDSTGKTKTISKGNEKKDYEGKIIDIIGTYTNDYGKNVQVCAKIRNGNDLEIEGGEYCESINLDFTKPTAPVLTASDNVISGNWHKNDFNINVSGGGTSPSGIYYLYGIESNDIKENVDSKKVVVNQETSSKEYKFMTCNNAGVCSEISNYNVKLDKTKPVIDSFVSTYSGSDYVTSIPLKGTAQDALSGIVKYKIDKSSSYNNNGWTNVKNTTSKNDFNGTATSNGKYYLWIQDAAGNYSSTSINISNCGQLQTVTVSLHSDTSSTISESKSIPGILKLVSVTSNTGYISNSSLSGNTVYFTAKGGTTYEERYNTTCRSTPNSYRAHEEEYCTRYYCPYGGDLSNDRCVGSSYEKRGGSATYSCDCSIYTNKYMNCGGGSVRIADCDDGYRDGGYYLVPADPPTNGDSCKRSYSRTRTGYRRCIWGRDYNASCSRYTTDYYCDRGDFQRGSTCYYCSKGTINNSGTSCKYECTKYYDYWQYKVTIKYYA